MNDASWQAQIVALLRDPDAYRPVILSPEARPVLKDRRARLADLHARAQVLSADLRASCIDDPSLHRAADALEEMLPTLATYTRAFDGIVRCLPQRGPGPDFLVSKLADVFELHRGALSKRQLAAFVVECRSLAECAPGVASLLPTDWTEQDAESLTAILAERLTESLKVRRRRRTGQRALRG